MKNKTAKSKRNRGYAERFERRRREFGLGPIHSTLVDGGTVKDMGPLPYPRPLFQ